ncbi:MAG: entericidin A/B family lipoprotein, partial [Gammaproteobacteria bacterium]
MKIITKCLLPISIFLALSSLLTACQTAKGFGEDLEKGGKAISKAA